MKRIITGCLLLNFAMAAQAECNISSSIQNIDYGKRSAAMRQVDRGKTTQLADRTITLVMQCDQDAHIRVQLNTANISNNGFGFGPNGSLNLIASDAFSGSNNLDLALASGKNDNPGSTGTASISTSPNNWLVFMQNGQEVVIDSGKSVSLTLTMAPAFKDEGELTDMTDITGNLTVLVGQNEKNSSCHSKGWGRQNNNESFAGSGTCIARKKSSSYRRRPSGKLHRNLAGIF